MGHRASMGHPGFVVVLSPVKCDLSDVTCQMWLSPET